MKHIRSWKDILYKMDKRYLSSNRNNYLKRENGEKVKGDIENYLNSESPLKDVNEGSEWVTTAYPEGTLLPNNKRSGELKINPETTSIIMFPGQGNQYVGMGKHLMHHTVVQDMFDKASAILGYNLKKVCLDGPESKLNETVYCQPATLVCSLAAIEELKAKYPSALSNCIATCGFSVGEIAALVFAGCINFEKAVHLTKIRAKAMQICSDAVPSGMMTILYGSDSLVKDAIIDAKKECLNKGISNPVCEVANYLIPECKVLAGHNEALNYIKDNLKKYKIRKASRLKVSGAFHTVLMKEAAEPFKVALQKINIKEPVIPVLSNALARPYNGSKEISRYLVKQIYMAVKWEQILHYLYERPPGVSFPHTYECGPGKSLTVILNRVNSAAAKSCHNIYA